MKTTRSEKLFKEACELIPGGVNSPVRACLGVGADPLFIASAKGSHVITVDGQEMIDFVESWGPMLLGHSHPEVTKAVVEAAGKGTSYGAPCPAEVELARMVVDAFPGMDMVRMVNSGTEATMSALRLAWRDRTHQGVEVHRLLSWPCRSLPCQRGFRRGDPFHPRYAGRAGKHGPRHPVSPLQ